MKRAMARGGDELTHSVRSLHKIGLPIHSTRVSMGGDLGGHAPRKMNMRPKKEESWFGFRTLCGRGGWGLRDGCDRLTADPCND